VRKVLPLVATQKPEEAQAAPREALSALDKAAQKGVIHDNAAARRKSRLTRQFNIAAAAAAEAKQEPAPKTRRRTKKES
jgi:small subunit ribosomal protein S20